MAQLPRTQVWPWTPEDLAHFTDATSSLSSKFWKHIHPNPASASDTTHTTKCIRFIFFKILQEIATFQVSGTTDRLKETKISLKSKE